MNWNALEAHYSEAGQTWTVMRPALVFELHGEGHQLAPHGAALFDRLMAYMPEDAELTYIGNRSRSYRAVNTRSLRRIRSMLEALGQKGQFYFLKDALDFDCGSHSIDLTLGSKHASISDTVVLAMPLEAADDARLPQLVEAFTGLVTDFPFWGGVAGYGFNLVWGRECEMAAMPVMMRSALRYQGLLVRDRTQETYSVHKLKSAGWLTYLGGELVAAVGGMAAIAPQLDEAVEANEIRDGLLLRAGERPPIGDVNRQDADVLPLASVNRAIAPVRVERWMAPGLFGVPEETANEWLARFDR